MELRSETYTNRSIPKVVPLGMVTPFNSLLSVVYSRKMHFLLCKSVRLNFSWFFRVKVQFFYITLQTVWIYYPANFMVKWFSELEKLALKVESCVNLAPK